ncbi:3-deoxy-manno-octulosonate cytidylyltransferase [Microbacterium sp. NPDC056234]|uniref:3-deoxy-manno-octulosonate cytidylyltransferase n=1 Tax=Microbacterium sp. NPDC056234 TaxID=3345757 RepID=UPI0035E2718B
MRVLAVIPSRYPSTRLEGKPLLMLGNRSVVQRVWDATVASGEFDEVVVATDDRRIFDHVQEFGGRAIITSDSLENGSERVAAAADALDGDFDVVANIQGDQPFVSREAIRALIAPFRDGQDPEMTTVAMPLAPELADDPNTVKIVTDMRGRALYFSRSLIPANPKNLDHDYLQHLGLYAFRRDALRRFPTLIPTPLERAENLEQLRALEHGLVIIARVADSGTIEINTPDDYERAQTWVRENEA